MFACSHGGGVDIVKTLVAAGASVEQEDTSGDGIDAPRLAAESGDVDSMLYMHHAKQARVDDHLYGDGKSVAHVAAENGHVAVLQALHGIGVSMLTKDPNGATPVWLASKVG